MGRVKKKEAKGYLFMHFGFTPKTLEKCTNGFSNENLIGKFQFGEVYRGTFRGKDVTVKIWKDNGSKYEVRPGDNESRFDEEIRLLEHFIKTESHPSVVKLLGYCVDGKPLATVYHLKPVDTVHNLLEKDSFTWEQRIKVALGFASLLEFMHAKNPPYLPYLIRNIDAAHIMVDKDGKPILFDFSMISGGILTDRRELVNQYVKGCSSYVDPFCADGGKWSDKSDVFSYGVLLLSLISKKVCKEEGRWAKNECKPQNLLMSFGDCKSSLVHHSLESGSYFYSSDGIKITKLAMQCVEYHPEKRPTMKQVFRYLQNLHIVRHHSNDQNINKILNDDEIVMRADNTSGKKSELLLAWHWGYFSKSFHLSRPLYKDQGPAGKRSSGAEYDKIKVFSYEELNMFTNGFSDLIGKFHFGKVFRGKINERKVMVKRWEYPEFYSVYKGDNEGRLRDEIELLQHPKLINHPNLVKLIGYCYEEDRLGAVYDLDPLGSASELAPKGSFTWLHRIKVAFEFACLLKFLHTPNPPYEPYLVRNIDAAHIMLDKEYTPKLFEFGMLTGGIILDQRDQRNQFQRGCYGYVDMDIGVVQRGVWLEGSDVFAYGVVLLGLISKKICTEDDCTIISEWARKQYSSDSSEEGSSRPWFSLVDSSLEGDSGFDPKDGVKITKLAMHCVEMKAYNRPTMKQVVKRLLNLRVVRTHAKEFGI